MSLLPTAADQEFRSARIVADHCDRRIGFALMAVRQERKRLLAMFNSKGPKPELTFIEVQKTFECLEDEIKAWVR